MSETTEVEAKKPVEKPVVINEELRERIEEYNRGQRLNMGPGARIMLSGLLGGGYGFLSGFYRGFQFSALQYLAENAHRMPTTKGGWYFYHKRKNYVVLKDGLVSGVKRGTKYGLTAAAYFSVEAQIDKLRGTIDLFNTMAASGLIGYAYGAIYGLSRGQALRSARAFLIVGTVTGALQDFMRYKRGNSIWYYNLG